MILVTGATGLNGGQLVRRLSAQGVPVRALVRNRAKAAALAILPGVEIAEGDMARPETLTAALRGIERAMLISSSTADMHDVQANFITAAKQAGVRHLVKLSGGIPSLDSPFRFARMHAQTEKTLEQSGIAFTHLRPGEFMQSYFRSVPTVVGKGMIFRPMEQARIASIDAADIAAISALVLTGTGHEGKTYQLTGPEALTMDEVAQKLSVVVGKPIRYVNISPADAKQGALAAGIPAYLADGLDELFSERRKGAEAQVWTTMQDVFEIQPTSFDTFAQRHAAVFRGEQPVPAL